MKKAIKEFIIEEHANACSEWKQKIESRWPELFENQFKKGDWIKLNGHDKIMVCISSLEESKAYGFNYKGEWVSDEEICNWTFKERPQDWQPATKEEVETALIAEAKRRGYKNGNYKCLYMPNNTETINDDVIEFELETNSLWLGEGGHSNKVFDNGRWATIIEEEKPEPSTYTVDRKCLQGVSFTVENKDEEHQTVTILGGENPLTINVPPNTTITINT